MGQDEQIIQYFVNANTIENRYVSICVNVSDHVSDLICEKIIYVVRFNHFSKNILAIKNSTRLTDNNAYKRS